MKWGCTSCVWEGEYKDTVPTMYRGRDWQDCPSCHATAIPKLSMKDIINYHDIVRIVERQRPKSAKMVISEPDISIEKVLNRIREGLKKLKKGD